MQICRVNELNIGDRVNDFLGSHATVLEVKPIPGLNVVSLLLHSDEGGPAFWRTLIGTNTIEREG